MRVAEFARSNAPKTAEHAAANVTQSAQDVSAENRDATSSPVAVDAAPLDKDHLKEAMRAARRLSEISSRRLKFEYQEDAGVFQVSVVGENDEVIRKIPTDGVLSMIENIERIIGLGIDTTA